MIVKQKCRIVKINPTEEKGAKNFKVRKVVFAWKENNYEQYLTVDVLGDNADMFVNYNEQQDVGLIFAIGGRKWDSPEGEKYFNQTTFIGLETIVFENKKEVKASIDAQFPPEETDLPF